MTRLKEVRELIYSPEEQVPIILSLRQPRIRRWHSHDRITDFVHSVDVIDTSAITALTTIGGLITGSAQVAANSIVWIQSGADTIVYANTSSVAKSQGSADMEIVLTNVVASTLTSTDFFHF